MLYATRSNEALGLIKIQIEVKEKRFQYIWRESVYHGIFNLTLNTIPCFCGHANKAPLPYVLASAVRIFRWTSVANKVSWLWKVEENTNQLLKMWSNLLLTYLLMKRQFSILFSSGREVVVWKCSVEKVFLKFLEHSQENTSARVSFLIKLLALGRQLY